MRYLRNAMVPFHGCLALAVFLLGSFSLADAATELKYLPGGLNLAANQSVSAGSIKLQMQSNCVLALTNSSGETLWHSGPGGTQCSLPEAAFASDGSLMVSSSVNGRRKTLWTSHTSGSGQLVLSETVPYLEILNSDGSSAWRASGALTLDNIYPPMMTTIGARGSLYSRSIQKRPAVPIAAGDRVYNFQAADGDEVQVLVKTPAPKNASVDQVSPYPMTPGQKVLDYLSGAISYATGSNPAGTVYGSVVFPKATYEVEDFSGCDQARGANGYVHWLITSVTDLVIDGQGSTLNFNGFCQGIQMDWVQRIVFKNFNLDWPKVQVAGLATVQNVDTNTSKMELVFDSKYPVEKYTVIEAITSWDRTNNYWSLTNPSVDEYLPPGNTKYLGNQTIEVPDWVGFQNGDTALVRFFAGEAPAFTVDDSKDVTIDNVNVYSATSIAFIFGLDRGIRLANSSVTRLPGSNRLISSGADAVHMAGNQGDIVIEGNTLAYQGDDGLNINATMWCNSSSSGSNNQPCNPSLAGSSGGPASGLFVYNWFENVWLPGDALGFFDSNFLLSGTIKVQSIVTNPHVSTELMFSKPSPAKAQFLADFNYGGARYIIRNNRFLHNRARGVLLQTSEGLVTGNVFDGQTLHSIYVISSPYWGEGPGAQNLTVANNTISHPGNYIQNTSSSSSVLGAVVVAAEDDTAFTIASPVPLHQNVIFADNTVRDAPGPGFFISTTNNVIMQRNHMDNTNQSGSYAATYGTATSASSIVVTQASNVFFQGNELCGSAGPISVDMDTTSGINGLP